MKSIRELYRIGTGPSSSHTMGPRKAAEMFLDTHKGAEVKILLNLNSMRMLLFILYSIHFCYLTIAGNIYPSINNLIKENNIKILKPSETIEFDTVYSIYEDMFFFSSFDELSDMLEGIKPLSLKRAVYLVESAYYNGRLDYDKFCSDIRLEVNKINLYMDKINIRKYKTCVNAALFEYFSKPNWMNKNRKFSYDVDDPGGINDITKLFVTKLMKEHSGQCQSLPLYYKILCNELGGSAFIAFCPNHIYLKHIGEDGKWYNIELTTGSFARDEWYIQSMDISTESIRNGVFLTAITEKEEIAYMLNMLAETYRFKYKDYDYFTLLCAQRILDFLPNNCHAMYLKLQTLQQWGYDYINKFGKRHSDFFEDIVKDRNEIKTKLSNMGFNTIEINRYIDNVEKAYNQLKQETPQNWKDFKNNNYKKF